jgi:hypothetical protein
MEHQKLRGVLLEYSKFPRSYIKKVVGRLKLSRQQPTSTLRGIRVAGHFPLPLEVYTIRFSLDIYARSHTSCMGSWIHVEGKCLAYTSGGKISFVRIRCMITVHEENREGGELE